MLRLRPGQIICEGDVDIFKSHIKSEIDNQLDHKKKAINEAQVGGKGFSSATLPDFKWVSVVTEKCWTGVDLGNLLYSWKTFVVCIRNQCWS